MEFWCKVGSGEISESEDIVQSDPEKVPSRERSDYSMTGEDSDEEEEGYRIYLNENCQNEYFGEDDDDYLGAESYED